MLEDTLVLREQNRLGTASQRQDVPTNELSEDDKLVQAEEGDLAATADAVSPTSFLKSYCFL